MPVGVSVRSFGASRRLCAYLFEVVIVAVAPLVPRRVSLDLGQHLAEDMTAARRHLRGHCGRQSWRLPFDRTAESWCWIADNVAAIDSARPEMPKGFSNRLGRNWRVMFAISDLLGDKWGRVVRDAALKLRREHDEDQPWHICALKELRRYIREVHKDNAQKPVSTTAFVDWLLEDPVSDWHLYPPGRKITAVQMSLLMRRWYHVKSEPIGPKTTRNRGWKRPTDFAEYFLRVLNDPLKLAHSLTKTRVKRR